MKTSGIQGYVLDSYTRAILLKSVPPLFPDVIAHHVTVKFGKDLDDTVPNCTKVRVIGVAVSDKVQAVVVELDGISIREDGKRYHITISIDRATGAKPVDSNKVISTGFARINNGVEFTAKYGFV